MNHAFYMHKIPPELRSRIEAEPVYATWLQRGETLESVWTNPAIMETVLNRLTLREKNVLRIIVTSIGSEPFDWAKLERLTSHAMSGAEAKVGFLQLLKKGLVYMLRKSWGEHVYVLAVDALGLWQKLLLLADGEPSILCSGAAGVEGAGMQGQGLAVMLFHSLLFIGCDGVKLTKNGSLHKKQLQKWLDILVISEEDFNGSGLKYAFADEYPVKLAVMMEFLVRLQLAEQRGDQLNLCGSAVRGWLSLTEHQQNKQLYAAWKKAFFPGAAWLQHAVLLLDRQPEGVWINIAAILNWLRERNIIAGAGDNTAETSLIEQLEQQWLLPLIAFGWMEKGFSPADSETAAYRWRVHPLSTDVAITDESDVRFYVQPDFEVLVPPHVPFSVRWQLSSFTDRIKADQVSVYKLSKESMQRGMANGCKLEQMLQLLEYNALYGIPDNVKLTMEQWAKPFGKVKLAEVLLLRCEDAAVASELRKLPGLSDCLLEELGERAWIIRAERLKRLIELLEKAGWMPGKVLLQGDTGHSGSAASTGELLLPVQLPEDEQPVVSGNGQEAEKEWIIAERGFFYSRQTFIYFDMEPKIPEIHDLYPDLQGIPQAWMKDYRAYHASTRREMVEKAMEWKTALQVRHNGRDEVIAPRKLQETRGTWSMTGLEQSRLQEVCLFPEDWQEMKIIVPGINDKY